VLIFFIGFFTLWATYLFEFKPLLKDAPDVLEKVQYISQFAQRVPFGNKEAIAAKLVNFAQNVPIPLSTYCIVLLGIANQVITGQQQYFFWANIIKTV